MQHSFNVAGPCFPDEHYMLPALGRLPKIRRLVDSRKYFVLHAPRQSGKTTALQALVRDINADGGAYALYCTLETLQTAKTVDWAMTQIKGLILRSARAVPGLFSPDDDEFGGLLMAREPDVGFFAATEVSDTLSAICRKTGKPVVVFFDEADCLFGDVLISFLRQLRDGYVNRRTIPFPVSIALVGMLDIRDYKAQIRPDGESLGQISPFNIISEDIQLRDFGYAEVAELYAQHTAETGQAFEDKAIRLAYELTCGQPWLVNAIARECVEEIHDFDFSAPVTADDITTAKETIIRRRDTHVDSLMERLREPRVRRIVEPVILGDDPVLSRNGEDFRFVIDLGLLKEDENHALVPGNPMYGEIILRYLSHDEQESFYGLYRKPFWIGVDGGLDMAALMAEFQRFWRENSEADREVYGYKEATPHLVLTAFLQRIANGGGRIDREFALGSGRLDICMEFAGRRYAVELKMKRQMRPDSYSQLAGYLDRLGLAEGWLAVFDQDKSVPWDQKIFTRDETVAGKTIHVVGL